MLTHSIKSKILTAFVLFTATLVFGTIGYLILEPGSTLMDALYMTVITISTVGYGEVIDLTASPVGRFFTMMVILFGMGNLLYVISTVTSLITDGELQEVLRRKKMEKKIDQLNQHIILCGSGMMSRKIIEELIQTKHDFVLVSESSDEIHELLNIYPELLYIEGDPSYDNTLKNGAIERASGLIIALHDDKESLFIAVTAKKLNSKIRIVTSVVDAEMIEKFKTVGVETTISPNLIGGLRLVSEMIRPSVTTFLDIMLRDTASNTRFADVKIPNGSPLIGKTIKDCQIKQKTGLLIVSLQKPGVEGFVYNPSPHEIISEGMAMIVIGSAEDVQKLRTYVS